MSLGVLAKTELPNLLSGLETCCEARGTWEPEVMDKRPGMQEKRFLHEWRWNQTHSKVLLGRSSWEVFLKGLQGTGTGPSPVWTTPGCPVALGLSLPSPESGVVPHAPLNQQGGWAGGEGESGEWGRGRHRRLSISRNNSGLPTAQ